MKPPAFQFYPDDFLGGTLTMTFEERGFYITLLCLQWSKGFVTADDFDRLGSAMALPSRNHVKGKFIDDGNGCLKNPRLEEVRRKQDEFRANRSESGKAGAATRWRGHSTANGSAMAQLRLSHSTANGSAMAQPMANDSSPSPSPSPNNKQADRRPASPVASVTGKILFEKLAALEGCDDVAKLTQAEAAKIRHALTTIVVACPDVTPWEIDARAKRYPEVMPEKCRLTAHGLAANWAKCAPKKAPPPKESAEGPPGWFAWFEAEFEKLSDDAPGFSQLAAAHLSKSFQMLPRSWQARAKEACRQIA